MELRPRIRNWSALGHRRYLPIYVSTKQFSKRHTFHTFFPWNYKISPLPFPSKGDSEAPVARGRGGIVIPDKGAEARGDKRGHWGNRATKLTILSTRADQVVRPTGVRSKVHRAPPSPARNERPPRLQWGLSVYHPVEQTEARRCAAKCVGETLGRPLGRLFEVCALGARFS